ncbi:hypothetical protein EST38_g1979 [Candolleomyces aberdarensis]|uniref:PX domain-containing protein n=1 Tax=Candolleomyces aberdarensis TaxID=2316362 RepID=A0A4Q2DU57_9AGAR|nr:hypothetical protein EST38_g1979 [Candolleomyces aberdarensis]
MDGFDDLLAPSRQALESNPFASPFADPFGGRSSPDPWASPFGGHEESAFGSTTAATTLDDDTSAYSPVNPYKDTPADPEPTEPVEEEVKPPSDPLDSAAVAAQDDDEDNRPLGTLRSPGFRESIAPPISQVVEQPKANTILPPSENIRRTSLPSELLPPIASSAEDLSTPTRALTPPSAIQAEHSSFSPAIGSSSTVISPLDRSSNVLENTLAGLSLGGPDILSSGGGGWQSQNDDTGVGGWGQTTLPPAPIMTVPPVQTDEDSDDDKPISQTIKRTSLDDARSPTTPKKADNGLLPVFVITVDDPQKVGDPIRPFTMYTVHTRFQKSAFSVLRRYSDFVWLYETLCFNNPGVVVPPVPEKNTFGRFEDQFLRQRRLALEKCIQKIANHPQLGKDPDLKLFLESDTFSLDVSLLSIALDCENIGFADEATKLQIKHRKAAPSQDKGGLLASIGSSLTGPRFNETDEWFDKQKSYLDSLESQLRGLAKAIELVAKHRLELSGVIGEFAQAVSDLSASDVGKQLSVALGELADVERTAQEIQSTQSEQDMSTLMATVDEYARLINSVRAAFSSRIRVFYAWKNAESDLLRTKQNHERNRAQGRIPTERLGYSLSQIAEAERRVLDAKHEYDHVCKLVKIEVARFEQERIDDFKDTLHAFLEGMISRQKELISTWENYQQLLLKRAGSGAPAQDTSA